MMNHTQKAVNHSGVASPARTFAQDAVATIENLVAAGIAVDDELLHQVAKLCTLENCFHQTALKNRSVSVERGL